MLAPGIGGLVLVGWMAGLVALGYALTRNRDIA
jgi:hypothetical protein